MGKSGPTWSLEKNTGEEKGVTRRRDGKKKGGLIPPSHQTNPVGHEESTRKNYGKKTVKSRHEKKASRKSQERYQTVMTRSTQRKPQGQVHWRKLKVRGLGEGGGALAMMVERGKRQEKDLVCQTNRELRGMVRGQGTRSLGVYQETRWGEKKQKMTGVGCTFLVMGGKKSMLVVAGLADYAKHRVRKKDEKNKTMLREGGGIKGKSWVAFFVRLWWKKS